MEKNINLAKILNGKPVNTKLWSPLFGDVYTSSICSEDTIIVVNHHAESSSFYNNGKYFDHAEAEPLLFPSKEMRDWNKFAWLMNYLNRLAGKNPFDIRDILGSSNKLKNMIMKQEMQKSILKIQTAVETLTRQKVIDKNAYDFVYGEIKSLSESVENIVEVNNLDETLLTFTDKEEYVNQHINLADTSVLCKELNRRKRHW